MDKSEIRSRIFDIIHEQMGVELEKINEETHFIDDLGMDSLDCVELIMEFEDAFDLNIPDETAEKAKTVGDIVEYISANS